MKQFSLKSTQLVTNSLCINKSFIRVGKHRAIQCQNRGIASIRILISYFVEKLNFGPAFMRNLLSETELT